MSNILVRQEILMPVAVPPNLAKRSQLRHHGTIYKPLRCKAFGYFSFRWISICRAILKDILASSWRSRASSKVEICGVKVEESGVKVEIFDLGFE